MVIRVGKVPQLVAEFAFKGAENDIRLDLPGCLHHLAHGDHIRAGRHIVRDIIRLRAEPEGVVIVQFPHLFDPGFLVKLLRIEVIGRIVGVVQAIVRHDRDVGRAYGVGEAIQIGLDLQFVQRDLLIGTFGRRVDQPVGFQQLLEFRIKLKEGGDVHQIVKRLPDAHLDRSQGLLGLLHGSLHQHILRVVIRYEIGHDPGQDNAYDYTDHDASPKGHAGQPSVYRNHPYAPACLSCHTDRKM